MDFLMWVVTPFVGYVIGDRFSYIVLRSLYMQNTSQPFKDEKKKLKELKANKHNSDADFKAWKDASNKWL